MLQDEVEDSIVRKRRKWGNGSSEATITYLMGGYPMKYAIYCITAVNDLLHMRNLTYRKYDVDR